jgi:hypothetical protein
MDIDCARPSELEGSMSEPKPPYEPPAIEDVDCDGETLATASMVTGPF